MPDEFQIIKSLFAPLSKNFKGALELKDDAALIETANKQNLVVSNDGFVEGIHFRYNDDPKSIGEKILRASISDLAAMGAAPKCWFLTAAFGKGWKQKLKPFAKGCLKAQKQFGLHLAGGDSINSTKTPSFFSLTVIGTAKNPIKRSGGKAGDRLYVSGTLGDAALGLLNPNHKFLANRYLYPEPRLALGLLLPKLATAAIDLSDGLLADLNHLCKASNCGAQINVDALPISPAAIDMHKQARKLALNAGDDYELLIAAPPKLEKSLFLAAERAKTPLTHIGMLTRSKKIIAIDDRGKQVKPLREGFNHF